MRVVISQSMYFPWVGLLEQVRLCDVFVHYDDVQFSKGSFVNRVQIKPPWGVCWLSVPLSGMRLGQSIEDVEIQEMGRWCGRHISLLTQSFEGARFANEAIGIVKKVYESPHTKIGALARTSLMAVCEYFGLTEGKEFIDVKDIGIKGCGSERVLSIVKKIGGSEYITGHGALDYLDHQAFENAGIRVRYMNYEKVPYPQLHGSFTPFVSSLDLIANCGKAGVSVIKSNAIDWREFHNESE